MNESADNPVPGLQYKPVTGKFTEIGPCDQKQFHLTEHIDGMIHLIEGSEELRITSVIFHPISFPATLSALPELECSALSFPPIGLTKECGDLLDVTRSNPGTVAHENVRKFLHKHLKW